MGYSKEIYNSAMEQLNRQRMEEEQAAQVRRARFFTQCPRGEEIEHQLATTALQAAKAVLKKGGDTVTELQKLRESNQALQKELNDLLTAQGLPLDYLKPHYRCEKCHDEGFCDGIMCDCLKKLLRTEACRRLNATTPLALSTFESFDLRYYPDTVEDGARTSPRKHMEQVFYYCKNYAENFSLQSPSLLFFGGTGLSKTHLSLAIANVVLQKGYGVVYDSVHNLMTALERERFSRDSYSEDTNQVLSSCDLLILDDLGTEFRTQFVTASIYNLVNTRIMAHRPTIISTNLTTEEMEDYYTRRFVSRVNSNYTRLPFYGRDIRQIKAAERHKR
ncbi:MAG: ATP-binding protein [Oscillospiraceae bacterium]|nr:ATP-binding protein [Oscillospiraceae bacterium]